MDDDMEHLLFASNYHPLLISFFSLLLTSIQSEVKDLSLVEKSEPVSYLEFMISATSW